MAKVNYDAFNSFDINDACDYFDCEDQRAWKKIGKFIVADGQEYVDVMENHFDFEDTAEGEYAAFDAGVRYALTKMNAAFAVYLFPGRENLFFKNCRSHYKFKYRGRRVYRLH